MRFLSVIPERMKRAAFSGQTHFCPVCESDLRSFFRFGHLPAEWCPVCTSMKRHRLLWVFMQRETTIFAGTSKRVLHIAPEEALEPRLRGALGPGYVTADLYDPRVQDKVDIMDMPYADDTFDVILCSHVLEHVEDDQAALQEFRRVLNPGGWAAIMVPYNEHSLTDEDPSVASEAEREKRFGQADHVRYYGRDLVERLERAGLRVRMVRAIDLLGPGALVVTGVDEQERIFIGTKPDVVD